MVDAHPPPSLPASCLHGHHSIDNFAVSIILVQQFSVFPLNPYLYLAGSTPVMYSWLGPNDYSWDSGSCIGCAGSDSEFRIIRCYKTIRKPLSYPTQTLGRCRSSKRVCQDHERSWRAGWEINRKRHRQREPRGSAGERREVLQVHVRCMSNECVLLYSSPGTTNPNWYTGIKP